MEQPFNSSSSSSPPRAILNVFLCSALATEETKDVFPTPGGPCNSMGANDDI